MKKNNELIENKLKKDKKLNLISALLYNWNNYPFHDKSVFDSVKNWELLLQNVNETLSEGRHNSECQGSNMSYLCERCLVESYVEQAENLLSIYNK